MSAWEAWALCVAWGVVCGAVGWYVRDAIARAQAHDGTAEIEAEAESGARKNPPDSGG
jgi:hypothetical protein